MNALRRNVVRAYALVALSVCASGQQRGRGKRRRERSVLSDGCENTLRAAASVGVAVVVDDTHAEVIDDDDAIEELPCALGKCYLCDAAVQLDDSTWLTAHCTNAHELQLDAHTLMPLGDEPTLACPLCQCATALERSVDHTALLACTATPRGHLLCPFCLVPMQVFEYLSPSMRSTLALNWT